MADGLNIFIPYEMWMRLYDEEALESSSDYLINFRLAVKNNYVFIISNA